MPFHKASESDGERQAWLNLSLCGCCSQVWAMGHHRKPRALGDGDARVEEALPEAVEVEGVGLCEDEALPIARIEAGQQLKLNLLMRTTVATCCANLARISTADTARGRFAGGRTVAVAMAAVAVLAIIAKAASSGARSDANHRRPTISWTWRGVCERRRRQSPTAACEVGGKGPRPGFAIRHKCGLAGLWATG
jgi:hypothetical protein